VGDNERVVGGGVEDVEQARFDDEEVAIGLSGAEGGFAVGQVLRTGDGADMVDVRVVSLRKAVALGRSSIWD
jgi:hypothetical protein